MAEFNPGDSANNPSQTGGPGITLSAPVNGEIAPGVTAEAPDPVAAAQAALDKALADKAAAGGDPVAAKPAAPDQPQVAEVPSQTDDAGMVVYDETGDPGLDMALSFIGRLGIDGTDPSMVAAANGDFSFIEAKLAALGDEAKGWEQHLALGKQAFSRQLDAFRAEQAKTLSAVHTVAGGEEQWKALVAWSASVASPEEKAALDAMFDAGPIQAQMAARAIMAAYAEAKGTTVKPANPASAASGVAPAAPTALTVSNYYKEVEALHKTMGNSMDTSSEYAALRQKYFGR